MPNSNRIDELIEEILESDRAIEEVCADCPELLDEVRERLRRLRSVEAQFESLFPSPAKATHLRPSADQPGPQPLPVIPDYEVQTILGRGGMGVVYRAVHLKLNRLVALKMLLAGPYATHQEHQRFLREAEAVARLRHPSIVQIYDFGEVDGRPYFTMEYISGGSLAEKLGGVVQPARESAQMVAALAQAVHAAHQGGIIHRDVKPANVMLAENGAPKIGDFGLARRLDGDTGLTHTGARMGTPSYMAPEQMSGDPAAVSPAIDIFALGALLYEMLTGVPPFRGKSLSDTERRLASADPEPPSRRNPKVPRDLETICLKCLEKDPKRRFGTAEHLAEELGRFLRHEPILARPIPPAERWMRWIRRNPLPSALAVTAALLLVVVVSGAIQEGTLAAGRAAERTRLTARFDSGVQLVQDGRFAEARAILGKLGDGGNHDLRKRIDRTLDELGLVEALDAVGIKRSMVLNAPHTRSTFNADAASAYAAIFSASRIGTVKDQPKVVAQRILKSDIRGPLVASLDDWAVCEPDDARRNWVLEVVRQADPDPAGWRDRVRDPSTWNDRVALAQLADAAQSQKPSMQLLRVVGDRLRAAGLDATAFCSRVQVQHPDSFLANLALANALRVAAPAESMRYYQAALAIRPQSATAHNNLGVALSVMGRSDEAIAQYQQSLKLDNKSAQIRHNLGLELFKTKRVNEAIEQIQQAIALAPTLADSQEALAIALMDQQRFVEAETALSTCLKLLGEDDSERQRIADLLERCRASQPPVSEKLP